jgi:hypothetical protein
MTVGRSSERSGVDPLAEQAATWLLRWVRTQLGPDRRASALGPPPPGVRDARQSTVFLTTFNGRDSAGFSGQGRGLLEAVMSVVAEALLTAPAAQRLQLDILADEPTLIARPDGGGKLPDRAARQAWQRVTSWQDGLVVGHEGKARWLVPMQLVLQGMARKDRDLSQATPKDVLMAAMSRVGLRARDWDKPGIELWTFSTSAWVEDSTHTRALPLVQGVVPVNSVDRGRMLASARAGGDFLLRIMRDDGSFKYTVDPWLGVEARSAYNIVRHAGTAAALFEVAGATGDDRYLRGALRAMAFMEGWFRPGDQEGLTYLLDKDGKAKLGAFGLALLAISRKLEAAPEAADRERALQLGRQIVAMQQPDGSFDSYLSIRGDEPDGSVSLYYPGEAMLGLARVAALGIDEGFLAAAHRGADYLIASRAGKTKLPPDAWLMQALDVLYRTDPKPAYVEHSMAIAKSMLADQYPPDAPPIYAGGFGGEPIRSTRTTARIEGIVAACRLGFRVGDARAPEYLAAIQKTLPHLLPMQYDADNSFFLDDPAAVAGAMRGGLDDAEIRIDYVQHHVSAMLGMAGLLAPAAGET